MTIQNPMNLVLPPCLGGGGLVLPYCDKHPQIGLEVFIAHHSSVIGEVTLGNKASVWFGAVLRGDIAPVLVGEGTNIQDNSVLHVGTGEPCIVKNNVVVGHGAILHGCTIEDNCLIGMGATVLNRAVIGQGSIVGAGALVTQDTIIPPNSLVVGTPATVKRELTEKERKQQEDYASKYIGIASDYRMMEKESKNPNQ